MDILILNIILYSALTAFLELDYNYIGQFQISRPIITGTIFGILIGDIFHGLQIGLFIELILIDFVPVGSIVPPSGTVSAATAMTLNGLFDLPLFYVFPLGLLCGYIYSNVEKLFKTWSSEKSQSTEDYLTGHIKEVKIWILKGIANHFSMTFMFTLIMILCIGLAGKLLYIHLPENLEVALILAYLAVPWIGLGRLISNFGNGLVVFNGNKDG